MAWLPLRKFDKTWDKRDPRRVPQAAWLAALDHVREEVPEREWEVPGEGEAAELVPYLPWKKREPLWRAFGTDRRLVVVEMPSVESWRPVRFGTIRHPVRRTVWAQPPLRDLEEVPGSASSRWSTGRPARYLRLPSPTPTSRRRIWGGDGGDSGPLPR
jgi:hypothetical protein